MSEDCIALTSPKLENDNEFITKLIPKEDAEKLTRAGFCFTQGQWLGRQQFVLRLGFGLLLTIELDPDELELVASIDEPAPSGRPCTLWSSSAKKDIVKLARRGLKQAEAIIRKKAVVYIDILRVVNTELAL